MRADASPSRSSGEEGLPPKVPARVRWFVWAFLGVFAFTGLAEVEAFPFTGWRLFSGLRHERTTSLAAFGVDDQGVEAPFSFKALPPAYHWGTNLLTGFTRRSTPEQARICDAWMEGARASGLVIESIRIYEVSKVVSERVGDRGAGPATRTLRVTCGDGAVHVED